jgi:hypothetical protein
MTKRHRLIASLATALMIGAASGTIASAHDRDAGPGMMRPGYGMGPGMTGQGYHMGPGMMGQGYQMGPGMMNPGQGMMGSGQGMMGPGQQPGQMGPGMMGPGHGMGPGMVGPRFGMGPGQQPWGDPRVTPRMDLSTSDVRAYFEDQLAAGGNDRLKVGKVEALDDDTIQAGIVTVDGSLVASYRIDRHSGAIAPAG